MYEIQAALRVRPRTLEEELTVPLLITRLLILDVLFEGDPLKWRSWLDSQGSPAQIAHDLPFVEMLCSGVEVAAGHSRNH